MRILQRINCGPALTSDQDGPFYCHADEKDVKAAMKKQPNKGGIYFPIAAVQVRA